MGGEQRQYGQEAKREAKKGFADWNEEALMSDSVIVQFVGFEAKALVREYNFYVRQASSEMREFTLTIVNEAFDSRRVRYQDAPEICSLRLHRELATYSNRPPQAHYRISEIDLDEYRNAHAPKASGNTYKPKPAHSL